MARSKKPGVYKITNRRNNKFYIGSSSINVHGRMNDHKSMLRNNIHTNIHLQRSAKKYGQDVFAFEVLEYCENVLEREQYYIDTLKPNYNICSIARNSQGVKRSPETIEKIRLTKIGNKYNEGRIWTTESRNKVSRSLKAKYKSGDIIGRKGSKLTSKQLIVSSKSKIGNTNRKDNPTYRGFIQLDSTTLNSINRFETARIAADSIGRVDKPASSKIIRACRTGNVAYGFKWKFE